MHDVTPACIRFGREVPRVSLVNTEKVAKALHPKLFERTWKSIFSHFAAPETRLPCTPPQDGRGYKATGADRNVLLDRGQLGPALAQAIRATDFPTHRSDSLPVHGAAVAAEPGDRAADKEGRSVRGKRGRGECKFWLHRLLSHG